MRRRGARVLGPYDNRGHLRVITFDANGQRKSTIFDTQPEAERYIDICRSELATREADR